MDPELIKRVLNYHGQQMTKIWDIEKGNKSLQKLDVKGLDYHEYQQRAKELAIQDRSKRVKIHHFIVEKAEVLFRPPIGEHSGLLTPDDQDAIVPLPPLETVLNISKDEKKLQFFKMVKVGDLIIGQIVWRSSTGGSSLAIKILTLDGGKKREVTQLNLKGFIYPSQMPPAEALDKTFLVNDFVRAEIVELTDSDKIHLGLRGVLASPDVLRHYPLGVIKLEDMPSYVRFGEDKKPKGWTFDDCFEFSSQWENPEALPILAKRLGLMDDFLPKPYTNMIGLSTVSLVDMAPTLRKVQAAKWAFRSVSDGIKYFKEGQETEAFQCLNKALSIDPANVEGLVARGALFANRGNFDKAIEDFLAALKENIMHPNAQKYLAETLCAQGKQYEDEKNMDDALTSYQRCLAIVPGHAEAREAIMEIIGLKRKQLGRFELVPLPSDDRFESIRLKLVKNSESAEDARPMDSDQSDGEEGKRVLHEPTPKGKEGSLSPFSRKMATIDSTHDNPESKSAPTSAHASDLGKEYMDFLNEFVTEPAKIGGSFVKGEWKEVENEAAPPPPMLVSPPPSNVPPPPTLAPPPPFLGLNVSAPPPPSFSSTTMIKQEDIASTGKITVVSQEKLLEPSLVKPEQAESTTPVSSGPPVLSQTPPSSATPPVLPGPLIAPLVGEPPPEAMLIGRPVELGPPPHMMHPPPIGHPMGHPMGRPPFDAPGPPGFYPPRFGFHEPGYHYPPHHGVFRPPHHAHEPSGASYDEKVRAFLERIASTKTRPESDYGRTERSRKKYEEASREKKKEHKEKKKQKKKRSRSDSSSTSSSSSASEEEMKKKKKKKRRSTAEQESEQSNDALLPDLGVDLPDIDDLQSKLSAYYKKVDKKEEKLVEKEEKVEKEKKKKKKKKRARSSTTESDSSSSEEEVRKKSKKKNKSKDLPEEKKDVTPSKHSGKDGREISVQKEEKKEGKEERRKNADRKDSTSIDLFEDGDDLEEDFMNERGRVDKKIPSGKILINLNYKKSEEKPTRDGGALSVSRSVTLGVPKPSEGESASRKDLKKRSKSPDDRQSKRATGADATPRAGRAEKEVSRRSHDRKEKRSGSRGRENVGKREESRRSRSRDRSRRERSRSRDRGGRSRRDERTRSRSVEKPKAVSPLPITRSQVVYDPKFAIYRRVDIPATPAEKTTGTASKDAGSSSVRRSKSPSSSTKRSRSRERRSRSRDRRSRSRGRDSPRRRSRSRSPYFPRGGYRGRYRGRYRTSYGNGRRRSRSISPIRKREKSKSRTPDRDRRRSKAEPKAAEVTRYPEEPRRPQADIPEGEPPTHKATGVKVYAAEADFLSDNDEYDKIEELIKKNRAAKKEEAKNKNKEFFKP